MGIEAPAIVEPVGVNRAEDAVHVTDVEYIPPSVSEQWTFLSITLLCEQSVEFRNSRLRLGFAAELRDNLGVL